MSVRRCCLVLLLPALAAGCKSADKGGPLGFGLLGPREATPTMSSGGSQRAAVDPILTNGRIPPQHLPVPGKDGYTINATRDPLLGSPAAASTKEDRPDRTAAGRRTAPPKPDEVGASPSSIPRVSVPYRPTRATSPAALASRLDPNDPAYKVGDDLPPLLSVSRADRTADELTRELKKIGATISPATLERGGYTVRGEIELDPDGKPGLRRAYEAIGPNPSAALRQLLDQISGDLRR